MVLEEKLGPDQREVIDEIRKLNKPVWIQGYAGSGKSVLLLHVLSDYMVKKPNANVCVVVFTRALVDLLRTGLKQIPSLSGKRVPVETIYSIAFNIKNRGIRYDAIFCDEVQDIPLEIISSLRSSCSVFIIAGDAAQSIYNFDPQFNLAPAKPHEILNSIAPVEAKLNTIYRLTSNIISVLRNVYKDLFQAKTIAGKINTDILVYKFKDTDEEIEFCWNKVREINSIKTSSNIAILLYQHDVIVSFINQILILNNKPVWNEKNSDTKPDYELLNDHLKNNGIPMMYIGNRFGSLEKADLERKIIIMTYHSAKGLDFDYVYLPLLGKERTGKPKFHFSWPTDALLLVALSRSKDELIISYTEYLFEPIKRFIGNLKQKDMPEDISNDDILF